MADGKGPHMNRDNNGNILNAKGCALLAVAVVRTALQDWVSARDALLKCPANRNARHQLAETEEFFSGDWFEELREFAPDVIPPDMMATLTRRGETQEVHTLIARLKSAEERERNNEKNETDD